MANSKLVLLWNNGKESPKAFYADLPDPTAARVELKLIDPNGPQMPTHMKSKTAAVPVYSSTPEEILWAVHYTTPGGDGWRDEAQDNAIYLWRIGKNFSVDEAEPVAVVMPPDDRHQSKWVDCMPKTTSSRPSILVDGKLISVAFSAQSQFGVPPVGRIMQRKDDGTWAAIEYEGYAQSSREERVDKNRSFSGTDTTSTIKYVYAYYLKEPEGEGFDTMYWINLESMKTAKYFNLAKEKNAKWQYNKIDIFTEFQDTPTQIITHAQNGRHNLMWVEFEKVESPEPGKCITIIYLELKADGLIDFVKHEHPDSGSGNSVLMASRTVIELKSGLNSFERETPEADPVTDMTSRNPLVFQYDYKDNTYMLVLWHCDQGLGGVVGMIDSNGLPVVSEKFRTVFINSPSPLNQAADKYDLAGLLVPEAWFE